MSPYLDDTPQSHSPLKIAILECDEPIGKTKEKYGSYGGLFQVLLEAGAKYLVEKDSVKVPHLDISKHDIVNTQDYPNLDNIDAVLLTGSRWNAFDDADWILRLVQFTKEVLAQRRVRIVGVCFGHQIIGRALDMKVQRNKKGWEVAVLPIDLTDKGRQLFGLETLSLHQCHRDILYAYPAGFESFASTPICEVQTLYEKNRLISVQGHPEFNGDVISELIQKRYEMGIFDQTLYEDALSRSNMKHDGIAIGAAFIRFLLES